MSKTPARLYAWDVIAKHLGLTTSQTSSLLAAALGIADPTDATGTVFGDVSGPLLGPLVVRGLLGSPIDGPAADRDVLHYDSASDSWIPGAVAANGLGLYNVVDYGAVLDSVTDDSVAVGNARDAAASAGGGTIWIPGRANVAGLSFDDAGVPITIRGIGSAGWSHDGSDAPSALISTSRTAYLFRPASTNWSVREIALINAATLAPTAGGAIQSNPTTGLESFRLFDVSVHKFWDCLDLQGTDWQAWGVRIYDPVNRGWLLHNDNDHDAGDPAVIGGGTWAGTWDSAAGIEVQSGGGIKFLGHKVNKSLDGKAFLYGLYVNVPTGVQTSILHFVGGSIENTRSHAVVLKTTGAGSWPYIVIDAELAPYNAAGRAVYVDPASTGKLDQLTLRGQYATLVGSAVAAIRLKDIDSVRIDIESSEFGGGIYDTTGAVTNVRDISNVAARAVPAISYGAPATGSAETVIGTGATIAKPTAPDVDFSVDVTTSNATTGHHGLLPKLDGNATHVLLGDGTWGALSSAPTAAQVRDAGRWEPTVDDGTDTLIFDSHTVVMDWTTS